MLGQVIHDQVHEFDLVGAQTLARKETGQSLLGGTAVQADERPDEQAETVRLLLGSIDLLGSAEPLSTSICSRLGEVGWR